MVRFKADSLISLSFGLISISFVLLGDSAAVYSLTREDGLIENLTVIFYMVALIFSFISIFRKKPVLLAIVWAILCFIFLGEETSWFQRVFDFSVLPIEQVNAQNEFNLHNLNVLEGGSLMDGSIGLSTFLKSQNLFRIGFFSYFLILPLLLYISNFKKLMLKIGYKKPDNDFILVLFLVFVLSFILVLFSPVFLKSALAETREMLYAFFIMVYIIAYIWPNKKIQHSSTSAADTNRQQ